MFSTQLDSALHPSLPYALSDLSDTTGDGRPDPTNPPPTKGIGCSSPAPRRRVIHSLRTGGRRIGISHTLLLQALRRPQSRPGQGGRLLDGITDPDNFSGRSSSPKSKGPRPANGQKRGNLSVLGEDCCFFINASGIVQNKVQELRENIKLRQAESGDSNFLGWWKSSWAKWLFPLLGPLTTLFLILLIGPCVFQIILQRVRDLTQTATGRMLMVAAYSKLPSRDPEAP